MRKLKRAMSAIDKVNEIVGKVASFGAAILATVVVYGVVNRYVFNISIKWEFDTSTSLFLGTCVLSGGYALLIKQHVTMDLISRHLPVRTRAIVDLVTYLLPILICLVLIWKGIDLAYDSFRVHEADQITRVPMYPLRAAIPIGAFLLLLQLVATYIRTVSAAITNQEEV